jgi:hypothetical protein
VKDINVVGEKMNGNGRKMAKWKINKTYPGAHCHCSIAILASFTFTKNKMS